jgi:hypothetical protein
MLVSIAENSAESTDSSPPQEKVAKVGLQKVAEAMPLL